MPLTFPLSTATFADLLRPLESTFDLVQPSQVSGTGGGEIISVANAPAYWTGAMTTALPKGAEAHRMRALFDVLRQPARPFLMYLKGKFGPQNDPTGSICAHRSMVIAALETSRLRIGPAAGQPAQRGFPPELQLLPGDMIGFRYGSNPLRYALHRVAPAAAWYGTAGSGLSVWIDVEPPIRPGAVVGAAVALVKAPCKALAVPGSISGGESRYGGGAWSPIQFTWRQTLR
jgi:hypothetical protein